jgi:hypothetical protein
MRFFSAAATQHVGRSHNESRLSPDVLRRDSNHSERHNYQRGHLYPEVIGETACVSDLCIHCPITSLQPMA